MLLRLLEPCLARNGSAQIFDLYIYISMCFWKKIHFKHIYIVLCSLKHQRLYKSLML